MEIGPQSEHAIKHVTRRSLLNCARPRSFIPSRCGRIKSSYCCQDESPICFLWFPSLTVEDQVYTALCCFLQKQPLIINQVWSWAVEQLQPFSNRCYKINFGVGHTGRNTCNSPQSLLVFHWVCLVRADGVGFHGVSDQNVRTSFQEDSSAMWFRTGPNTL